MHQGLQSEDRQSDALQVLVAEAGFIGLRPSPSASASGATVIWIPQGQGGA